MEKFTTHTGVAAPLKRSNVERYRKVVSALSLRK